MNSVFSSPFYAFGCTMNPNTHSVWILKQQKPKQMRKFATVMSQICYSNEPSVTSWLGYFFLCSIKLNVLESPVNSSKHTWIECLSKPNC